MTFTTEIDRVESIQIINDTLGTIPQRQRFALVAHLALGFNYREVGEALGVSAAQARVIEIKAIRKLRHPSRLNKLKEAKEVFLQ